MTDYDTYVQKVQDLRAILNNPRTTQTKFDRTWDEYIALKEPLR